MSIKILTDSAADYELTELKERDVVSVPLTITFEDGSYQDGAELSKDEFYHKLVQEGDFPSTAQPSPESFLTYFKEAKEKGDTVIAITLASGLSGTYQSANIAKSLAEYENIFIIDSCSAVIGLRLLVDTAVKRRDEGKTAQEIINEIEDLKPRVKLLAMVDTLEYLHKGGRLTKAQAKLGEMAKLKPIITINQDGTLSAPDKSLGKGRAFKKLVSALGTLDIDHNYPVYYVYTHLKDNCQKFVEMLSEQYDFINPRHMYDVGPTIGTHIGVGAFGFVCILKEPY